MEPARETGSSACRALEGVPGIDDVVWALLARLDRAPRRRVVFLSPNPRAGTTVVAAATAITLLQHRRVRVCLLETNVRFPAAAGYLGLDRTGLTDVLAGRARLEDCLQQPRGCSGLHVLPAGTARAPIPGEFTTAAFGAIVASLGRLADYLLVDAPPVLDHLESRLLARDSDGALLVLRAGRTSRSDAERTRDILAEAGVPVLGAIFNDYEPTGPFDPQRAPRPAGSTPVSADYAWLDPAVQLPGAPSPPGARSERRQIELLERRIAKLTRYLANAEENLQRLAAQRAEDGGIPSIYRTVQGLSPEERALAFKQKLMQKIYQANVELRQKLAQHP
ncbi:MAG TPA: CpsD/CapB family tyrosine-protein kinase [Planctomycetota bacterium]|nr:CpsD/CapB family tyrosine-protein kinase [Planctomycetota bacterium]